MAQQSSTNVEKRVFLNLQGSISKLKGKGTQTQGALHEARKHVLESQYIFTGKYGAGIAQGSSSDQLDWLQSEPIRLECQEAAMRLRRLANARYEWIL